MTWVQTCDQTTLFQLLQIPRSVKPPLAALWVWLYCLIKKKLRVAKIYVCPLSTRWLCCEVLGPKIIIHKISVEEVREDPRPAAAYLTRPQFICEIFLWETHIIDLFFTSSPSLPVEVDEEPRRSVTGGLMILRDVSIEDTAVYQCEATNVHGSIVINAFLYVIGVFHVDSFHLQALHSV